jgi:hypothetical protein
MFLRNCLKFQNVSRMRVKKNCVKSYGLYRESNIVTCMRGLKFEKDKLMTEAAFRAETACHAHTM